MKKVKQTQGNKKLLQYLTDLCNNKNFISVWKHIAFRAPKKERKDLMHFVAEKYGLDWELFNIACNKLEEGDLCSGDMIDVCSLRDDYDEEFNECFPYVPVSKSVQKQLHIKAYPISIRLHKLTTKRDLLDFVEKRWEFIEDQLEIYRKKKIIKSRKNSDISEFIYEYLGLIHPHKRDIKELKKIIDKKYPNNTLTYNEIHKLHNLERQRRYNDISLVDEGYFDDEIEDDEK